MKSILLIEQDPDILSNLVEFFEMEGYYILSAKTENKAIELALQFIPDLIICDMPKPGIDGHEVLRILTSTLNISEIPFIFCSTMCEKFNRQEALELGADDYIVKPFDLESMLQIAKVCISSGSKRQRICA